MPSDGFRGDNLPSVGIYYSTVIDGLQRDTHWYRMTLEGDYSKDMFIKVSFFASNSEKIWIEGKGELDLDEIIQSGQISAEQKMDYMDGLFKESVINSSDALIQATGRYLWIRLEFTGTRRANPVVRRLRIYLPGEHITDYLPEIYRDETTKDNFFHRFMSIFQTFILDMEHDIYNISRFLDLELADKDFFQWLCSWLDIQDAASWEGDRLKIFLGQAMDLYASAGTRGGIEKLVEIYTGKKPFLVEYFQVKEMIESNIPDNPYKKIYGTNPYRIFILIDEVTLSDRKIHETMLKLLSENIPAQTEAVLVPLKSDIYLDMHTYVGINSSIGEQTLLRLGSKNSIPFNTIIE